jgi:hypothetical protein
LSLTIALEFEHAIPGGSMHEMKLEFGRIMGPASTSIAWRDLRGLPGDAVAGELVVVRFEGWCAADGVRSSPSDSHFLAITEEEDGEIMPFSRVNCSELAGMLALDPTTRVLSTPQIQRSLGRAMARVLAHETYHVLLRTPRHAASGVAKSAFTPAELFGAELRFNAAEMQQITQALSPDPAATSLMSATLLSAAK